MANTVADDSVVWLNKLIEKKPRLTLKTFDLKEAGHADTYVHPSFR